MKCLRVIIDNLYKELRQVSKHLDKNYFSTKVPLNKSKNMPKGKRLSSPKLSSGLNFHHIGKEN